MIDKAKTTCFKLLDIAIADLSTIEAANKIVDLVKSGGKYLVVTANPEIILEASRNPEYHEILKKADLVLADGVGIILASYLLGYPLKKGRVTGVDLVYKLAERSSNGSITLYLAGSTKSVLDKTTHKLRSIQPNIKIVGAYSGHDSAPQHHSTIEQPENKCLINNLNNANANILLLAFGHPKQEQWISEHMEHLNIKVGIGVGGAFDMISRQVRRAPYFVRSLGLEWFWRLSFEPRRIKRIYNAVILFPILVFKVYLRSVLHGT